MNNTKYLCPGTLVSFLTLIVLLCCPAFLAVSETFAADQTEAIVDDVREEPPPEVTAPEGMVLIPAGQFQMGSHDPEALTREQPVHTVSVDAFYMDTHEVTNHNFKQFVLETPEWQKERIPDSLHSGNYLHHWTGNTYPIGQADHPVVYVSWYAAVAYAKWAGKRLPTEAEWEHAARGGLAGQKYPWGNTIDSSKANYNDDKGGTTPVGKYPPNNYGLYDMCGNVWEWCLDAYDADYYHTSPLRNPLSDVGDLSKVHLITEDWTHVKTARVLRGGSWLFAARHVRLTNRFNNSPTSTLNNNGFRCVTSVTPHP